MFSDGEIDGVEIRDLVVHHDPRGWLAEIFREDEISKERMPAMGYVSVTLPGIARGPHEHKDQTDFFAFVGPATFKVYLWDTRPNSRTLHRRLIVRAGEEAPRSFVIPPGVVHAYRNIGQSPGMVINVPNRLFAGHGKKSPVDEIRHENLPNSPFVLD